MYAFPEFVMCWEHKDVIKFENFSYEVIYTKYIIEVPVKVILIYPE